MGLISKIGFGIAMVGVLFLLAIRWLFPALSLWIVISPLLVLAGLMCLVWAVEASFELFKIGLRIGFIIGILYLFWRLFL